MLTGISALLSLVLCAPRAAAQGVEPFSSARDAVRAAFAADHLWAAVSLADALVARTDLSGPQRVWALREAARLRAMAGDRSGAVADLRQALSIAPDDAEALLALSAALRDDDLDAALKAAQAAARAASGPGRAAALVAWAGLRADAGDEAGARQTLDAALQGGDELDALAALARLEPSPARARALAERALESARRAPKWYRGSALRLCGRLWLDLEDYGAAAGAFRAALDEDADDLDALRGLLEIQAKKPDEPLLAGRAPTQPGAGTAEPPDELAALRLSAEQAAAGGRPAEAVRLVDRFVDGVPDMPAWRQPDAYRAAASLLLELGDADGAADRARGCAERAFKLGLAGVANALLLRRAHPVLASPESPGSVEFAAAAFGQSMQARDRLHDREGARAALARGLRLLPESRALRLAEAATALDDGDARRARDAAARLAQDGPDASRAAALRLQARADRALGDAAAARRALERAVELAPEDDGLLDELLEAEAAGGDPAKARALVDRLRARLAAALRGEPGDWPTLKRAAALELWHGAAAQAADVLEAHRADVRYGFEVPWLVWHGLASAGRGRAAQARRDFAAAVSCDAAAACFGPELPLHRERLDPLYFDACLAGWPSDPRLYLDRGLALFERGRAGPAVEDFRRAVALKPAWLEAHVSLVSALASERRDREAAQAADAALAAVAGQGGPVYDALVDLRRRLAK